MDALVAGFKSFFYSSFCGGLGSWIFEEVGAGGFLTTSLVGCAIVYEGKLQSIERQTLDLSNCVNWRVSFSKRYNNNTHVCLVRHIVLCRRRGLQYRGGRQVRFGRLYEKIVTGTT